MVIIIKRRCMNECIFIVQVIVHRENKQIACIAECLAKNLDIDDDDIAI